jgi:hypothetical protein
MEINPAGYVFIRRRFNLFIEQTVIKFFDLRLQPGLYEVDLATRIGGEAIGRATANGRQKTVPCNLRER